MRIEDWQLLLLQKSKKKSSNKSKQRKKMNNRDARPTKLGAEERSKIKQPLTGHKTTHQGKCAQVQSQLLALSLMKIRLKSLSLSQLDGLKKKKHIEHYKMSSLLLAQVISQSRFRKTKKRFRMKSLI